MQVQQQDHQHAAAFREFAQQAMPWILGEPIDDADRLVRGTGHIAFMAGRKSMAEQAARVCAAMTDKMSPKQENCRSIEGLQTQSTRLSEQQKRELARQFAEVEPAGPWKCGSEFLPYHPSASHVRPDYRDGWNHCYAAAKKLVPLSWEPQFDAMSPKQEDLVREFCAEIAGPKGQPGRPPDPVRLLEMAKALFEAEREECGP